MADRQLILQHAVATLMKTNETISKEQKCPNLTRYSYTDGWMNIMHVQYLASYINNAASHNNFRILVCLHVQLVPIKARIFDY